MVDEIVNGAVTRQYTYGLQRISQNLSPAVTGSTWTPSFYGYDGGGSVRQLINSLGVVTDEYEYDAFGNSFTKSGTTPNNYLYRGEQFDSDLGLYYLRARYYNPATGRFLSRDPFYGYIDKPATLHKYLYAGGDPLNRIDPSGRANVLQFVFTTAVIASPAEVALITLAGGTAEQIAEWALALDTGIAEITSLLGDATSDAAEGLFDAAWDNIENAINIYDELVTAAGTRGGMVRGISCGLLSLVATEIVEHDSNPNLKHFVEALGTADCTALLEVK